LALFADKLSINPLTEGDTIMTRRFAVFIALFAIAQGVHAETNNETNWTGWLGPQRNGWVAEVQAPTNWPEQLQKGWSVEVGTGYGSPIVQGGRVYQHGRINDHEVVMCIDLKTGEVQWKNGPVTPFKIGGGGDFHGKGPKSSPTLSDGRLFTMSITGELIARDAKSGDILWRNAEYGKRFKSSHPYWGASTSPLVAGNRVFVHFGTDDEGIFVAMDAQTGKEIWTIAGDGPSYSSPLAVTIGGVRQIAEWNHEALVGIDRDSGEVLWEFPFPHLTHNQNMPTPAFHDGRFLLGGENRGLLGIQPTKDPDGWSVKELWHQKKVALDMSSAVVNDGLLYGMSHYTQGQLFCLDPEKGKILWQGPPRVGSNVTFLAIDGYILALLDKAN
jgi:outer membrane protein assembly factor BamB